MAWSLRTKLTVVLALLTTVPLAVAAVMGVRYFYNDKESFILELNGRAAAGAARDVERNVGHLANTLRTIATIATDPLVPASERVVLVRNLFRGGRLLAVAVTEKQTVAADHRDEPSLGASAPRASPTALLAGLNSATLEVSAFALDPKVPAVLLRQVIPVKGGSAIHAAILVRASEIFDLKSYQDPYEAFLVDGAGRALVHPDGEMTMRRTDISDIEIVRAAREQPEGVKRYQEPTAEGGTISKIGAYASVDVNGQNIGHVVIALPTDVATEALAQFLRYAAAAALGVLVLALVVALFFARSIGGPLSQLTSVARAVAGGQFDAQVPALRSNDELADLATAFGSMQEGLRQRDARLKDAHEQLVQSEKMGALGQLAAGITHEVKNPMAGIIGFAQLCLKLTPAGSPIIPHLESIEREGKRSKEILENLLRFARKEEVTFETLEPNQVVEESAKLVAHQLQLNKVKIERRFATDLPQIQGNLAQLQQVLMNFMLNAMHAMQPKGGNLTLSTGMADGRVVVEVKDEGHGISEDNKKKLFTPFFTTKERGKGTGLGLSVSYGIVRNHGGDIKVWSQQGVGTIFYVYLPKDGDAVQVEMV
jgi:signal transduction histidine kinase